MALMRVLIADDHAIVREGLQALLETEADMVLVGVATDGQEVVDKALALKPDVILLDLVMPQLDGIQAIHKIKASLPTARILVLTSFTDDNRVFPAIKAGALGYHLKDSLPRDLLDAIRRVYRGEPSLHPTVARKLMLEYGAEKNTPDLLTDREVEVLKLMAQGLDDAAIATQLVISKRTVRSHISIILTKLQLDNRIQAALYALRTGLTSLDE